MRLIDADAITKRMIAFCDKNCPYTPKERDVMCGACFMGAAMELLEDAPTIEPERKPERLADDDFETIRIHLNAYKEKLCNQQRWKEAEEYQRIIDRFMEFASAQPERKTGRWIDKSGGMASSWNYCSVCGNQQIYRYDFCPNCGADMRGDTDEVD